MIAMRNASTAVLLPVVERTPVERTPLDLLPMTSARARPSARSAAPSTSLFPVSSVRLPRLAHSPTALAPLRLDTPPDSAARRVSADSTSESFSQASAMEDGVMSSARTESREQASLSRSTSGSDENPSPARIASPNHPSSEPRVLVDAGAVSAIATSIGPVQSGYEHPSASSCTALSPHSGHAAALPASTSDQQPRSAPMIVSHPPPAQSSPLLTIPPLRHVQSSPHLQQYGASLSAYDTARHESAVRSTFLASQDLQPKGELAGPASTTRSSSPIPAPAPVGAGQREIVSSQSFAPLRSSAPRSPAFPSMQRPDDARQHASTSKHALDTGLPTPLSASLVAPMMAKRHSLGGPLEAGAARAVLKRKPSFSLQAEHIYPSGGVVTVSSESFGRNSKGKGPRLRQELPIGEEDETMTDVKPEPASPPSQSLISLPAPAAMSGQQPLTPDEPANPTVAAKRRRVTISENLRPVRSNSGNSAPQTPHSLVPADAPALSRTGNLSETGVLGSASRPQPGRGTTSREPISPLLMGFTQRNDTMAQQQLAAAKKVKEDQERLIQARMAGGGCGNSTGSVRKSPPGKGRGRAKTQNGGAKNIFATSPPGTSRSKLSQSHAQAPTSEATPSIVPSPSGLANRRGVAEKVRPLELSTSNADGISRPAATAVVHPGHASPDQRFATAAWSAPIGGRFFQSTTAGGEVVKTPQIAKYAFGSTPQGSSSTAATSAAALSATGAGIAIPSLPSFPALGTAGLEPKSNVRPPMAGSASLPQTAFPRFAQQVAPPPQMPSTAGPSRLQAPPQPPYRFGGPSTTLHSPTMPQIPQPPRMPPLPRRSSLAHLSFGGQLPAKEAFMQPFETLYDCLNDAVVLKNNFEDNLKRSADHLAIMERSSQTVERMVDEKIQAMVRTQTRELQLLESRIERLETEIEADRARPLPPLKKLPPMVDADPEEGARGQGSRLAARLGRLEKEARR